MLRTGTFISRKKALIVLFLLLSIFTLITDNVKPKRLPFCNQYLTDNKDSEIKFVANEKKQ
jgi:hypothetical protein